MDRTSIYFDMLKDYTIDFVGAKRVSILKNYAVKTRFTCVLTICLNESILEHMIIFKSKIKF